MKEPRKANNYDGKLTDSERKEFYANVELFLPMFSNETRQKLDFIKVFMSRMNLHFATDKDTVQLGPMHKKALEYFIYALLVEYDYAKRSHGANLDC